MNRSITVQCTELTCSNNDGDGFCESGWIELADLRCLTYEEDEEDDYDEEEW